METAENLPELLNPVTVVEWVICEGQAPFLFVGVHLVPPLNDFGFKLDLLLVEQLKDYLSAYSEPKVVVADLNSTIHGLLYQQISQDLLDVRNRFSWSRTWNAKNPFIWLRIDHAFASKHFKVKDYKVGPYIGSDRFPLIFQLGLVESRL